MAQKGLPPVGSMSPETAGWLIFRTSTGEIQVPSGDGEGELEEELEEEGLLEGRGTPIRSRIRSGMVQRGMDPT